MEGNGQKGPSHSDLESQVSQVRIGECGCPGIGPC